MATIINPCAEISMLDSIPCILGNRKIILIRTDLQDDGTAWYCLFADRDVIQWIKSSYSTSDYVVDKNSNIVTVSEKVYVVVQLKWELINV